MLYRICGRAGSGKTHFVMDKIGELINNKQHTFLIVPEQQALIAEREIITRFGNTSNMYVEVINFKRLCNRVFRETGGLSQSYIGTSEKLLIMAEAIRSVKGHLTEYKYAAESIDFVTTALNAINELKQYGISPKTLEEAAEKAGGVYGNKKADDKVTAKKSHLTGKLYDLSLIFEAYSTILSEGFDDSGDDLDRLCEVLEKVDFFGGDVVLVDSFYGFTVQEVNILCKIISGAKDTYITFLLDPDKNGHGAGELFDRAKSTFARLEEYATLSGIGICDISAQSGCRYATKALSFIEKHFCTDSATSTDETCQDTQGISHILCKNVFDEASAACEIIRELIIDKGAKYSEIAVCARNIDSYSGIIDTALSNSDIPYNFNVRRDLLVRPIISYILSAFDIISSGWQQQSVIKLVKTGLCNLTDEQADLFESYVRTWNITGKRFLDDEWLMNPQGYSEEFGKRDEYVLEAVNIAKEIITSPLIDFAHNLKQAKSCDEISKAVFELILRTRKDEEGELIAKGTDGDTVFWNLTMDALDCLSRIVGNVKMSASRYAELFKLIMQGFDTGKIPMSVDEVTVSSAEGLRGIGIKYIIILGVNDGIFPATPSEDSIFSDRDKAELKHLGIEISSTTLENINDEMFLAYKVITCASHGIYLIASERTISGEELSPSVITAVVEKLIPSLSKQSYPFTGRRRFMKSQKDLLDMAFYDTDATCVHALNEFFTKEYSAKVPEGGIDYSEKYKDYVSRISGGDYLSDETVTGLYGKGKNSLMTLSPSRLESFNNCAFSYFGSYILRLRSEKVAELGSIETGNIAHKILELLIPRLSVEKLDTGAVDVEGAVETAKKLLADYISLLCGIKGMKNLTKRFEFLYKKLSITVCQIVKHIAEEMNQTLFVYREFEMPIGDAENGIESVEIPLPDENGKLRINGKIDRTDVIKHNGKMYVRVVDYKTGTKRFSLSDVMHGTNLQMLLYLYSIIQNGKSKFDAELLPAGVLYVPVKMPSENGDLGDIVSDTEDETVEHPNGILINDLQILLFMEKDLSGKFIPVKVKKDGSFYANSSVVTSEDMEKLLNNAAKVSAKLASLIKSGDIRKNPIKCKDTNSCAFCELAPLCRFDFINEKHIRFTKTTYLDPDEQISTTSDFPYVEE